MKRRTFLGSGALAAIASIFGFQPKMEAQEPEDNPKGLPVVLFDEDDKMTNGNELFAGVIWIRYEHPIHPSGLGIGTRVDYYRECLAWVPEETPVISFGGISDESCCLIWGEVELYNYQFGDVSIRANDNTHTISFRLPMQPVATEYCPHET